MPSIHRRVLSIILVSLSVTAAPTQEKPPLAKPAPGAIPSALPPGALARIGSMQLSHGGLAVIVAFAPDGKTVASGGGDRLVRLWDVAKGTELRRFTGHTGNVDTVAYSPDGKTLASGSSDNTIRLWDVASGTQKALLRGSGGGVNGVAFSPDGKTLASKGHDASLRLWDLATANELRRMPCAADSGTSNVVWSPDGKHIAAVGDDNSLRLWDAASGKEARRYTGHQQNVHSLDVSPDGKWLASASMDQTVRLWDLASGKEVRQFSGHSDLASAVRFSPDRKTLASCSGDRTIRLWELETGKEFRQMQGHVALVSEISFSPDGKVLASAGWDYTVRLWDVSTGKELPQSQREGGPLVCAVLSSDGKQLVAGHRDGGVRLWDAARGRLLRRLASENSGVSCVVMSSAGDLVAVRTVEGECKLYETATGKQRAPLTLPRATPAGALQAPRATDQAGTLAFAPDGKVLAVVDVTSVVTVWDTTEGKKLASPLSADRGAFRVAFSPDGRLLATVGRDGLVRLWRTGTWQEVRQIAEVNRGALIGGLTFSPDGRTLVTWTASGSLFRTWELATGLSRRSGSRVSERLPTYSPCGTAIATVALNALRLWSPFTQKEIRTLSITGVAISSLSFAGDGRRLVSVGGDGTAVVWDLAPLAREGRAAAAKLTSAQIEGHWTTLAGADAVRAGEAIAALTEVGDAVAVLARERITRGGLVDPKHVRQLVAELDDDDFTVRERASQELEKVGSQAEGPLRAALKGEPSAEHMRRIGELLKKIEGGAVAGERLRAVRALEVLEAAGGAEARKTLEGFARGPAGDWLTEEARAVLARLASRPQS